jgi:Opioid growth factor receptor (OGFr) conserved region
MKDDPIVAFYSGGRDDRHRTLDEILGWPDDRLEAVHDYIQWLFPDRRRSPVNPSAPVVTDSTTRAFAARADLRERLAASLDRMLAFYGLGRARNPDGTVHIALDAASFPRQSSNWLRPGNHNHLRLTRIMQSLTLLGLAGEAKALQRCLLDDVAGGPGGNRITPDTIAFWQAAC